MVEARAEVEAEIEDAQEREAIKRNKSIEGGTEETHIATPEAEAEIGETERPTDIETTPVQAHTLIEVDLNTTRKSQTTPNTQRNSKMKSTKMTEKPEGLQVTQSQSLQAQQEAGTRMMTSMEKASPIARLTDW